MSNLRDVPSEPAATLLYVQVDAAHTTLTLSIHRPYTTSFHH